MVCPSFGEVRFCNACLQLDPLFETMTYTSPAVTEPPAASPGGVAARRQPITDVRAYLEDLDPDIERGLRTLGELLIGATERSDQAETAGRFTARCLGVPHISRLLSEDRDLNPVSRLTTAVALAEWITIHAEVAEVGPGAGSQPPQWSQTEIGGRVYRHPQWLRVYFPAGTLIADAGCVIVLDAQMGQIHSPEVEVYVVRGDQDHARAVLDRLSARANELNPYRGRAVRATYGNGLVFSAVELSAALSRDTVIVEPQVWREIDLGVSAVRDRHTMLNAHGLGARRGVLLCGPPGTGKSAASAVIAREVVGDFTVIYVEAKAGERLLTAVIEEAQRLGGPVLLILEDVDLWCGDRGSGGGGGLSELLQAMDIAADARILTLASTNDASTLDKAAIRTGRFDAIVEIGYPSGGSASRILSALIADLPGGIGVDTGAVVAALPECTTGSDIREIVRRAVLSADDSDELSTAALLAEVGSGRYRATAPQGHYL